MRGSTTSPTTGPRVGAGRATLVTMALVTTALVTATFTTAGVTLLSASPAAASETSDEEDSVVRYDMTVDLADDGVAQVALDLDVDFGTEPNRGPFLIYPVKQRFDDTRDRVYRISDVRAESSTGASTEVDVSEEGPWLEIRIGEEDRDDLTGVHSYHVTYTVEGWINSASYFGATTGLTEDELNLNVITDWEIPVEDVTVTVVAPAEVEGADCFAGRSASQEPCTALEADDGQVTFTQNQIPRGAALTVVAQYPAGTFGGVEPILQERWAFERAFALTPVTGGLAALLAAGGIGFAVRRGRQRGRDEQYLGLTPGLAPVAGQESTVGPRGRAPVAVQFQPPKGFRAGQLGTLIDEHADPHDVTATLIGLAVRGHLRIEKLGDDDAGESSEDGDWRLVRLENAADGELLPYEQDLLDKVFGDATEVNLSDLRTTFAESMAHVQDLLYRDVTERGWFRANPKDVRGRWIGYGLLLVVGGVALTVALAAWTSWALVGLPVVLVGIVVMALAKSAPARTAAGTAVLVQAQGFRQYLATVEADQIRFEEGEDVFSRYLPYAVAFGLTERWAKVFADLAAQGRAVPEPTWYVGPFGHAALWMHGGAFAHDLTSFTSVADATLTAPTPGSSGSSGSGGFAGGGVSGGGGGTW